MACFSRCNFARTILRPVFLIAILQERFYDLFFPLQFCRRLFTSDMGSCSFAFIILKRGKPLPFLKGRIHLRERAVLVRNLLEHSPNILHPKLLGRIQALLRRKIFGFGTHEPSHLYGEKITETYLKGCKGIVANEKSFAKEVSCQTASDLFRIGFELFRDRQG